MEAPAPQERATLLLERLSSGDTSVSAELLALLYAELHRLARHHMAHEAPEHTLQPTALVHEAYLRLVASPGGRFEGRRCFFALASKVMRNVRVDHARERRAGKRGGDLARIPLDEERPVAADPAGAETGMVVLDLHAALDELAALDADLARAVELRYFGGLGVGETAEVLDRPLRTTERRRRAASAWLRERLGRV
jgi:RNA polymerase sigma factor (TIGR02999 family)